MSIGRGTRKFDWRLCDDLHCQVCDVLQYRRQTVSNEGGLCRPETIEGNHRIYISEALRNADPTFSKRISAAVAEINATAIEIAQASRTGVQWKKMSHTNTEGDYFS
jgi:hypothetical protein